MKNIESYSISKANNLRLYIIEHSILLEEIISRNLGLILDIDWENSKSFGYGSSSLSFNQKVQIIQDLKGIEDNEKNKIIYFSNIRNKFAHVKNIETFNDFFTKTSNGTQIKNFLLKNYDNVGLKEVNDEDSFKYYFYLLTKDVGNTIINKTINHIKRKVKDEAVRDMNSETLFELKKEIFKLKNVKKIYETAVKRAYENLEGSD